MQSPSSSIDGAAAPASDAVIPLGRARGLWAYLFGSTVFLGSFLLFDLELIMGRLLLPRFGSSSSVWIVCLMFYQVMLLAGYAYAHLLDRRPLKRQAWFHGVLILGVVLLCVASALMWTRPIMPGASTFAWEWAQERPVTALLSVLGVSIGLPFVLVAGNGVILQRWAARVTGLAEPYRLYALSNVGSLLGLLSYPFVVERWLTLGLQSALWSVAALALAALALASCGIVLYCARRGVAAKPEVGAEPRDTAVSSGSVRDAAGLSQGTPGLWVLLSFSGSLLLAATTNQLCLDVSPIPVLWVLPLAIYLLSFVIAFSAASDRLRAFYPACLVVGVVLAWLVIHLQDGLNIVTQIAGYSLALLLATLFCHGSLYQRRPGPEGMTRFYLLVALGGACGGIFASVIAPLLFKGYWEYHLAIILAASLLFARRLWRGGPGDRVPLVVAVLLPLMALALFGREIAVASTGIVDAKRNFYGVLRVRRETKGSGTKIVNVYALMHGRITHGMQPDRTSYRYRPTSYFTEKSGIGLAIRRFRDLNPGVPLRMAVGGLGVGTLAAYSRPGDSLWFYEINPAAIQYATEGRYFTYLPDNHAQIHVVEGDARLQMQRELDANPKKEFDFVVLDAFNGDAVPAHLLTREAFVVYLGLLSERGVIAWNGTNRYLDFEPLASAVAREFGLTALVVHSAGDFIISSPATWILLARDPQFLNTPLLTEAASRISERPARLWTDDFISVPSLFR